MRLGIADVVMAGTVGVGLAGIGIILASLLARALGRGPVAVHRRWSSIGAMMLTSSVVCSSLLALFLDAGLPQAPKHAIVWVVLTGLSAMAVFLVLLGPWGRDWDGDHPVQHSQL